MKSFISYFFSLLGGLPIILKSYVMVVCFTFGLFGVGAVVAQPSIIESPVAIPWNETAELGNGGFQIRESCFKESILVSRPVTNSGVDTAKLGNNCTSKLSGSNVISIKPNKSESTKNGDESAENGDDWLYQFSIILVIIMNIFFLTQLNAQGKVDPKKESNLLLGLVDEIFMIF